MDKKDIVKKIVELKLKKPQNQKTKLQKHQTQKVKLEIQKLQQKLNK